MKWAVFTHQSNHTAGLWSLKTADRDDCGHHPVAQTATQIPTSVVAQFTFYTTFSKTVCYDCSIVKREGTTNKSLRRKSHQTIPKLKSSFSCVSWASASDFFFYFSSLKQENWFYYYLKKEKEMRMVDGLGRRRRKSGQNQNANTRFLSRMTNIIHHYSEN